MAPSKLSLIPLEQVVTQNDTYRVLYQTLKVHENRPIIDAIMNKAHDVETSTITNKDSNPYRAQAYRRAAIIIAGADFPLINKNNFYDFDYNKPNNMYHHTYEVLIDLGMPDGGVTTYFVSSLIHVTIYNKRLDLIRDNSAFALPPLWRNNPIKNDVRLKIALYVIDFHLTMPNDNPDWTKTTNEYWYRVHNEQHTKLAHEYYFGMGILILTECRRHILNMINSV